MKKQLKEEQKLLPNHIQDYFVKVEGNKQAVHSRELFQADKSNVDVKTDLSWKEIVLINKLIFNNEFLKKKGLKPVYESFLDHYMRLKISLDRKSRTEFVAVNRQQDSIEGATALLSNMNNITNPKK